MDEWFEEPKNQSPWPKGLGCFLVTTVCGAPFVLMSAFMVLARLTGKEVFSGPLKLSVFLLPPLLLATVCEIIFIPLAWFKGHQNYKPFLLLYAFAIFLYWATLISIGPF